MKLRNFYALRDWLVENTSLKGTENMTVEEKLGIFLYIVSRPASNQDVQERFSYSSKTISRCFYEVLDALLILNTCFVSLPSTNSHPPTRIFDDAKYYLFFEDCLSALDGIYIPVFVLVRDYI